MKTVNITYTAIAHVEMPDNATDEEVRRMLAQNEIEVLKAKEQTLVEAELTPQYRPRVGLTNE